MLRSKVFFYGYLLTVLFAVTAVVWTHPYSPKETPVSYEKALAETFLDGTDVTASHVIVTDETGDWILYEKGADDALPMASTTKIMTAVVVLEHANLSDVYTSEFEDINVEGSKMYLAEGEMCDVKTLLYGLLLESGNDAANVLAHGCSGSVGVFVEAMNQKAAELGMTHTHFDNPHGLTSETHYSSARDMARLACYAWKNPVFREIFTTKSITVGTRYFHNHHKLIGKLPYLIGGKTGYTMAASRCLVTVANEGHRTFCVVSLHDYDCTKNHEKLLKSAFAGTAEIPVATSDTVIYHKGKRYIPNAEIYVTAWQNEPMATDYHITFDGDTAKAAYTTGSRNGVFYLSV